MYLEHFGLAVSPFGISPRLDFLYKSSAFEEGMAHLVYGLENSEALVMITGAIGAGKTMAIQSFLAHLGDHYLSALVTNTNVDGRELLKLILEDLGAPVEPGADKSDILIAFKQFMIAAGKRGQRIVVVIDEAQNLSRAVLEEIRLLTNLGQGEEQPVQIILVGQPELEEAVQRPDLVQLKQRIRVHCRLAPLSRAELEAYVDHRMMVAGGSAGTFAQGALDLIFSMSGGIPRLVNTLCAEALLSAYVAGRRKVQAQDVGDATAAVAPPGPREVRQQVGEREVGNPARDAPRPELSSRSAAAGEASMRPGRRDRRNGTRSSGGRGRLWLIPLFAVLIVIAALAVSGRLEPLWMRISAPSSPAGGGSPLVADGAAKAGQLPETVAGSEAGPQPMTESGGAARQVALGDGSSPEPSASSDGEAAGVARADSVGAPQAAAPRPAAPPAPESEATAVKVDEPIIMPAAESGQYFIHASSFRTPEHAGTVAQQFTEKGLHAVVREQMVREARWYRVYIGPLASREEAVQLAIRLRDAGSISYYKVVRLDAGAGS